MVIILLFINPDITNDEYYKLINSDYDNYNEIPRDLSGCKIIKYDNILDLDNKIKKLYLNLDNFYRSFINKLIIIDKDKQLIYYKNMEGSSHIFSKNNFNLLTNTILFSKKLYKIIMTNPYLIKNKIIELPHFYFEKDYGFPNLNYCAYNILSDNEKKDRINKMYYLGAHQDYNSQNAKYWYKLL